MTDDQKKYLIEVAQSEDVISQIEAQMSKTNRRILKTQLWGLVVLISIGFFFYYTATTFTPEASFTTVLLSPGLIWSTLGMIVGSIGLGLAQRRIPEWVVMGLLACIDRVDEVIDKPPADKSRKSLARAVVNCARKMRRFRSLFPFALDQQIIGDKAIQAIQALKQLAYPVMLGTNEELKQVKEELARAVIRIGTGYWVQVGDLAASPISNSTRRRVTIRSLLPFLAGVVVPLAAAFIGALI